MDLQDTVRGHCADLAPALLAMHFRRLPATYFERYSAAEIARHLRLLAAMTEPHPVAVELRPLAHHAFEVVVVGQDHPGTVACITSALAADRLSLEDVQVAAYLEPESESPPFEPTYFVVVLRVSGSLHGQPLGDVAADLRERLRTAFGHLAAGNYPEAQCSVAVGHRTRNDPARSTPHRNEDATPATFEGMTLGGDFRLQRRLVEGGMAEIFLATQMSLNRTVAVKLLRHAGAADDDLVTRFEQECRVVGSFTCPYIVQVLAAGAGPDRGDTRMAWMAMEYLAGGDLARWLERKGPPPVELGLRWLRQALHGLHYAHRHDVLHRDVKPHNLLLTIEGDAKVSDFGLLKQLQRPLSGLTPRSAIMGTPHYMSPEQAHGEAIDDRSDLFSLGSTFFHVFSGRLPFDKQALPAILLQITQEAAPMLTEVAPQLPRPLAVIVHRMMARRREDRYQDAGVVLEDLASYERRGLLRFAEGDSGLAFPAADERTREFQPVPDLSDDMVI